jgi:two-component system nitrate/nitrite response regulator NarL
MSHALRERHATSTDHHHARGRSRTRLVICDDHRLLLEALAISLAEQGFTVEATVESPADAVRAVSLCQPDVLIMDLTFPLGSGIEAARQVVARHPRTRVIVMTGSDDPQQMLEALSAGVTGYLRKDRKVAALADAVDLAVAGGAPLDHDLLRRARQPQRRTEADRSAWAGLTGREQHILGLLVQGMSTREIVEALEVSQSTVRTHVQNIFTKLGVHSRLAAVALLSEDPAFHGDTDALVG